MIEKEYGITRRGISIGNPQANVILKIIHQTLDNIIRTFEVQQEYDLSDDAESP